MRSFIYYYFENRVEAQFGKFQREEETEGYQSHEKH